MNQTLENILVLTAMAVMLGTGFLIGDTQGNVTYSVEKDQLTYQYISFNQTIHKAGYEFEFMERIPNDKEGVTVTGRAYLSDPGKRIALRTGRSSQEIIDTCRHEILHYYFPEYRHPDFSTPGISRSDDPIYRLEDNVDFGICQDVAATALKYQNQ